MIGQTLGHFRITAKLGEGGMGEVYRAEDGKLGREVAIKVLPAAVAADPERLARFEREAKVLAALNHPAIAAIHSFESAALVVDGELSTDLGREGGGRAAGRRAGTVHFLVMELAPGETLADRIARGPLTLDEALPIARQIAEALEAAHEKGIVHRDLKPANVKVTRDGEVKVLDFGLARALEPEVAGTASSPQITHSPTLTGHATMGGLLLGTAAYMAPEQAAGRPADRRSDVWAFGALVLEMLTGRQSFTGETVSHVLAAVLKDEPDFGALPASVPERVVELLRRCLRTDPKRRLQAIGDARVAIEEWLADPRALAAAPAAATAAGPSARPRWPRLAAAALLAALAAAAAAWWARGLATPPAPPLRSVHLEMDFPAGHRAEALAPPAFSPDGRWIVFGARNVASGQVQLWLRSLERFESEVLPGTEEAILPFWSPDGRSLGYFQNRALVRLDLETRIAQALCECAPWGRGGAWGTDGTILFAPHPNSGFLRIPATGGEPVPVTTVDPAIPDGSHRYPVLLPDGEHFLFTQWTNSAEAQRRYGGVFVGSFAGQPIRRLLPDASSIAFLAPGHLFVQRAGRLVAVPFDPKALTTGEETAAIDTGVTFEESAGLSFAAASTRGDLLYGIGSADPDGEPVWLDRGGREVESLGVQGWFPEIAPSPDGTRYAVSQRGALGRQILIGEPARGTLATFTPGTNDAIYATWSPDGERLAYVNRASGGEDVFVQSLRSTAPPERVVSGAEHDTTSLSWSGDGRLIFFTVHARGKAPEARPAELWAYDLERRAESRLLAAGYDLDQARLSPDGRWLAYTAFESGPPQIYLAPFPALDARWIVSSGPGSAAHWRDDGTELFYEEADDEARRLMAVAIDGSASTPAIGAPEPLFVLPPGVFYLAPAGDHSRILALREVAAAEPNTLRLILNWRLLAQRAGEP